MGLTNAELRDALRDWVVRELPELTNVIWRDQGAPSPARPYATIKVTTRIKQGLPSYWVENDGREVTQTQAEARAEIQVYGRPDHPFEAKDLANKLDDSLDRSLVLESLNNDGVAFLRVEVPPTDAAAVAGTDWEPRAIYEATFVYNRRQDDPDVGIFERVVVNSQPIPEDN